MRNDDDLERSLAESGRLLSEALTMLAAATKELRAEIDADLKDRARESSE